MGGERGRPKGRQGTEGDWMRSAVVGMLTGAVCAVGGFALGIVHEQAPAQVTVRDVAPAPAPWVRDEALDTVVGPQDAYPCHEDEVLGFDPRFGPDRVGCMHLDYVLDLDE